MAIQRLLELHELAKREGREQFKGVKIDHKLVFAHGLEPEKHRLPLFLLGYLSRRPW